MIPRGDQIERVNFVAGQRKPRELPKAIMRELMLKLNIYHTYSSTVPTIQKLLEMITQLDVKVEGRDTRMVVPFWFLYYAALYDQSSAPIQSLYTTTSGAGNSYVFVPLSFAMTRSARPIDTLLDGENKLVTLGPVFSGTALCGTEAVTAASSYLDVEQKFNSLAEGEARPQFGEHDYSWIQESMPAAGPQTIKLPVGTNNQYRRIYIFTFDSSGDLSNAEINKITLKSRSYVYREHASDFVQAWNAREYSQAAAQTGMYVIDCVSDGRLSERIQAAGELLVIPNVATTGGTIHIISELAIGPFFR